MITSTANSQIKNIIALQTKARARNKQNAFTIEGVRMFSEVPEDRIVKIYYTEDFYNNCPVELRKKISLNDSESVSEDVFKKISDTVTPQGILTIVRKKEKNLEKICRDLENESDKNHLFMVLEDIQDPGNLGTIVRTSEAAGVTAVIMSKNTVDIYNPKVVRSTMGTIFRVPFVYVENLKSAVDLLKNHSVDIYAAHLRGNDFYQEDLKKNVAFLIGNEGNGLTNEISQTANQLIKIPMQGQVESLNAACASTILMYEYLRQNL